MWSAGKAVIITNNDWVSEKYKGIMNVIYLDSYEEVLVKAKDMVDSGHHLATHPQALTLKPNQTPYRSVILYPSDGDDNTGDILLIKKSLETFYQGQKSAPASEAYTDRKIRDFKVLDASMMDSVIPRIFHIGTG